jgi:hypothetical protein
MPNSNYAPGSQLRTVIKYAKRLHDTETFGSMDPYVQVILGSRDAKTTTKKDAGTNPVFNEELLLDFQNENEVEFRIWDAESIGSDKFVGEAVVSIQAVINNGGSWAGDLQLFRKGKSPGGLLNVHIFLIAARASQAPMGSPTSGQPAPVAPPLYPEASPPEFNPHYQSSAPSQSTAPPLSPSAPQPVTANYTPPAPYPQNQQPMPVNYAQATAYPQAVTGQPIVMAQPVMGQPVVGQPRVLYAQPVVATQPIVYGQPQIVYPQVTGGVVYAQPQVVYRPPGGTIIYRQ